MRRNQTLSQRAQTSIAYPRSCVSLGSSHRAACGWRFGSKTTKAKIAAAQIAARLQAKSSVTGLRAERHPELGPASTGPSYPLTGAHGCDHTRVPQRLFTL